MVAEMLGAAQTAEATYDCIILWVRSIISKVCKNI